MIEDSLQPEMSDGVEAPFWAALKRGQLTVQHCAQCQVWMFPTRVRCSGCGEPPVWQPVSGKGRIWSYTRVHPPVLPAFAPFTPYPVVIVELDEQPGIRMVGNLANCASDPINFVKGDIVIGTRVEALIRDLGDASWPAWRVIEESL